MFTARYGLGLCVYWIRLQCVCSSVFVRFPFFLVCGRLRVAVCTFDELLCIFRRVSENILKKCGGPLYDWLCSLYRLTQNEINISASVTHLVTNYRLLSLEKDI